MAAKAMQPGIITSQRGTSQAWVKSGRSSAQLLILAKLACLGQQSPHPIANDAWPLHGTNRDEAAPCFAPYKLLRCQRSPRATMGRRQKNGKRACVHWSKERKLRRSPARPANECSDVDVRAIVSFVLAITLVVVPVTKLSLGL